MEHQRELLPLCECNLFMMPYFIKLKKKNILAMAQINFLFVLSLRIPVTVACKKKFNELDFEANEQLLGCIKSIQANIDWQLIKQQ